MANVPTYRFKDMVAIVTGSSSGIGQAVALLLAQSGASVTLCGRDTTRLDAALQKCVEASGGHRGRFLAMAGDVTDAKFRADIVESTEKTFGRLDLLVCNAGNTNAQMDIEVATDESYDSLMDLNVRSTFFLIQKALPLLEKSKGNIIVMSSIASRMPRLEMLLYCMSKAALDHMTRCLAFQLAPRGIRVNSVNPTIVATRIFRDSGELAALYQKAEGDLQPLGSRMVTVEEVANAVAFLASGAASFITGQNLFVDGARTISYDDPLEKLKRGEVQI